MSSAHKGKEILLSEIQEATSQVAVGKKYVHYKNPDKTYTVLNIAITEADDKLCVIYKADLDPELVFVRPLSSWLEQVQHKNEIVDRFKLIT